MFQRAHRVARLELDQALAPHAVCPTTGSGRPRAGGGEAQHRLDAEVDCASDALLGAHVGRVAHGRPGETAQVAGGAPVGHRLRSASVTRCRTARSGSCSTWWIRASSTCLVNTVVARCNSVTDSSTWPSTISVKRCIAGPTAINTIEVVGLDCRAQDGGGDRPQRGRVRLGVVVPLAFSALAGVVITCGSSWSTSIRGCISA